MMQFVLIELPSDPGQIVYLHRELHLSACRRAAATSRGSGSCFQKLNFHAAPPHRPHLLFFGFFLIQTIGSQTEFSKWCLEPESSFFPHSLLSSPLLSWLAGWLGGAETAAAYISDGVAVTQWPVIQIPFSLSSMQMNPGRGVTAFGGLPETAPPPPLSNPC